MVMVPLVNRFAGGPTSNQIDEQRGQLLWSAGFLEGSASRAFDQDAASYDDQ